MAMKLSHIAPPFERDRRLSLVALRTGMPPKQFLLTAQRPSAIGPMTGDSAGVDIFKSLLFSLLFSESHWQSSADDSGFQRIENSSSLYLEVVDTLGLRQRISKSRELYRNADESH